jgi:hypothetical protein
MNSNGVFLPTLYNLNNYSKKTMIGKCLTELSGSNSEQKSI